MVISPIIAGNPRVSPSTAIVAMNSGSPITIEIVPAPMNCARSPTPIRATSPCDPSANSAATRNSAPASRRINTIEYGSRRRA